MNTYQLPAILQDEILQFEAIVSRRIRMEIDETVFKAHRVPFGIYEQRKSGSYMIRVRCPAGLITREELSRIAGIARNYQSSGIHLTTRGELQLHGITLESIIPVLKDLYAAGLSTRGGGGNTVRNIAGSWDSGINPEENFDILPHAVSLTSRLIAENDSWLLPRKYKIAFSSADSDNASARFSDLGFIAAMQNHRKGFMVYGAGGMGNKPAKARLLYEFIPEEGVYAISRAMKELFSRYGNRKNRHQARIRFLWDKLGETEFRNKLNELYQDFLRSDPPLILTEIPYTASIACAEETPRDQELYTAWRRIHVRRQKQNGLHSVTIPVREGDIGSEPLIQFTSILNELKTEIRITRNQNFLLINLTENHLPALFNRLFLSGWIRRENDFAAFLAVCAGASTCKLGIGLSKGLSDAIIRRLARSSLSTDIVNRISLRISGCPNSCALHLIADIGLQGQALRYKNHLYPAYSVFLKTGPDSEFSKKAADIPARKVPDFIEKYLSLYEKDQTRYSGAADFNQSEGLSLAQELSSVYRNEIPDFDEDPLFYTDWGADEIFSLTRRSAGECSAGVFDFIERDLKLIDECRLSLRKSADIKHIRQLILYSARLLLITRGIESGDAETILSSFIREFIRTGLISDRYLPVLERNAGHHLTDNQWLSSALNLAEDVISLYESMDDSFQFNRKTSNSPVTEALTHPVKDLRGVGCPMNFVKTKIELNRLKSGDILIVYLDDGEPIRNVPGSLRSEGHEILEEIRVENYWKISVRKH